MATVTHYDHATGQSVTRQMTADELAIYKMQQAEAKAEAEAAEAKAETKANALEKLGLTADEAAALFG